MMRGLALKAAGGPPEAHLAELTAAAVAAEAGALHSEGGKRCAAQAMHELAAAQHDALQHAARGGPEEQAALLQLLTLTPTPTPTPTLA